MRSPVEISDELGDVVGQLMREGLSPQTHARLEHAIGDKGLGGSGSSGDFGSLIGSMFGGQAGGQASSGGSGGVGDVVHQRQPWGPAPTEPVHA